ncbi:YdcF family protein, partial [Cellvibrio sp.]
FGEDQAHNTLSSLSAVAAELRARDMDSAVFVSDPTHMLRVLRIADDMGIEAYGSPTPTSPIQADPLRRVQAIAHELGALAVYFVTGGAPQVEQTGG